MARILGFHPRGPGSIPGVGDQSFLKQIPLMGSKYYVIYGTTHSGKNPLTDFYIFKVGKQ